MESDPQKISHDISIAIIQKDIGFIRETMAKMEGTMSQHDKLYARKEELTEVIKDMEQSHKDMRELIGKKVDNTDFAPIKRNINLVVGLVITAIIGALLSLVLKV